MDTENKLLECSGCGDMTGEVKRNVDDGMCKTCSARAEFDFQFAAECKERNEELKKLEEE